MRFRRCKLSVCAVRLTLIVKLETIYECPHLGSTVVCIR